VHDGVSVEAMNLGDERGLGDVLREVAVDEQMPTSADALRFVFTDVCESFRLPTMTTASLRTYERVGMKTVRIFFVKTESFRGVESGYPTSDTVSVFKYSNSIFMMSISNRIISDIIDTIRI